MSEKKGVTKTEIARACGFTLANLNRFVNEGIINDSMVVAKHANTNYYEPNAAYGAIVQYYRERLSGKAEKEKNEPIETRKAEADADLKRAKADIAELQLKELKGEVHRSEDVEEAFEDFGMAVRSILLSLPGRLAVNCANADSAAQVSAIIKKEVNETLNELKDYKYDPAFYAKRVRERAGWQEEDGQGTSAEIE